MLKSFFVNRVPLQLSHTHSYTPQCIQKSLHTVGRLLFQHLDAALHLCGTKTTPGVRERSAASDPPDLRLVRLQSNTDTANTHKHLHYEETPKFLCICGTHINFGGLGECPDGVNMVVEDDDAHHHPHAEQHGVCVGEPTTVLPGEEKVMEGVI